MKNSFEYSISKVGNDDTFLIAKIVALNGSNVKAGDIIFEVETSKTIIEIAAPLSGVLHHEMQEGIEVSADIPLYSIQSSEFLTQAKENHSFLRPKEATSTKKNIKGRKRSEINNLFSSDHGSFSSIVSVSLEVYGERSVSAPFIFKDSISDLLVYESSRLLEKYKELNSYFVNHDSYEEYDDINFGWGFDNGNNLKVLTIRSANHLKLTELQNTIFDLLKIYEYDEKVPLDLVTGSTITFTDLSRTSLDYFIPLINGKQSMILGLTKPKKNLYRIIAAYDHRVSAGLTVANFLTELKDRILSYYINSASNCKLSCYACGKKMSDVIPLGQYGFIKLTIANGSDEIFCKNCFEGW